MSMIQPILDQRRKEERQEAVGSASPAPEGGAVVITDDGWVSRLRPKKGNNN